MCNARTSCAHQPARMQQLGRAVRCAAQMPSACTQEAVCAQLGKDSSRAPTVSERVLVPVLHNPALPLAEVGGADPGGAGTARPSRAGAAPPRSPAAGGPAVPRCGPRRRGAGGARMRAVPGSAAGRGATRPRSTAPPGTAPAGAQVTRSPRGRAPLRAVPRRRGRARGGGEASALTPSPPVVACLQLRGCDGAVPTAEQAAALPAGLSGLSG